MLALFIAGLLLAVTASYILSGIISKPIVEIQKAAASVLEGAFQESSLSHIVRRHDELGQLARVFVEMAKEVHARVQQLKGQIEQLHIEIDQITRQQEVSEVTDSDFFKDLQSKADKLRHHVHADDAPAEPG